MKTNLTVKKWSQRDARRCILIPTDLDHKYSRGVLGVVTGSRQYPGAAVLSTRAAGATGVGALRFIAPNESFEWQPLRIVEQLVAHRSPEVLFTNGKVSAWLLGSGIGEKNPGGWANRLRHRDLRKAVAQNLPTVLDAGALYLTGSIKAPTLITPHCAELARLLTNRGTSVTSSAIEGDPKKWVQAAASQLGVSVLLKGSITYLADASQLIALPAATPWLATAGSGDVLAGIIGALVATNAQAIANEEVSILEVGASGALIHALAAEHASNGAPISALQITESIQQILRKILVK